jgi:hypothetical protein
VTKHPLADPKWPLPDVSRLSTLMKSQIWAQIESNLERMGDASWSSVVNARTTELLSQTDAERIDRAVFAEFTEAEGRPLLAATQTSIAEAPERYILRSAWIAAQQAKTDLSGLPAGVIGLGDNVFVARDVEGVILVVQQISDVERLLENGVQEGTVAVIDDAGGTLTAPILPEFSGVLCRGGTVRSHLGIIAREHGVPTLMAVDFAKPPRTGDRVLVRYSSPSQDPDAYYGGKVGTRTSIEECPS